MVDWNTLLFSIQLSYDLWLPDLAETYKTNVVKRVKKLQEKAISFKDNIAQVSNLFAQSKILKFEDFLHYRNINLVKNPIEKNGRASLTISSFKHKRFIYIALEAHK